MHPNYFQMPQQTRQAFERFAAQPTAQLPLSDLFMMEQYVGEHGVHSVYCKVKEFMPKHFAILKAASAQQVDK